MSNIRDVASLATSRASGRRDSESLLRRNIFASKFPHIFPSMSNQLSEDSPIALTEHSVPTKQHCHAKVDSSGAKVRFIPSPEFLSEFVRWRQSRMEILSPKCTFDRWYEALLKEQIWRQWVSNGLVKSMDIPSRNTLAHLYVNAKTPSTEKRIRSATKGLLALQRAHCAALAFTTNIIFL